MIVYNRIIMAGNLTMDPECKDVGSEQRVCKFGLAVNRDYKDKKTGSEVKEICFIDVCVWGSQAENCYKYLKKGSSVLVEGHIKFSQWKDKNEQNRSRHYIVANRVVFQGK